MNSSDIEDCGTFSRCILYSGPVRPSCRVTFEAIDQRLSHRLHLTIDTIRRVFPISTQRTHWPLLDAEGRNTTVLHKSPCSLLLFPIPYLSLSSAHWPPSLLPLFVVPTTFFVVPTGTCSVIDCLICESVTAHPLLVLLCPPVSACQVTGYLNMHLLSLEHGFVPVEDTVPSTLHKGPRFLYPDFLIWFPRHLSHTHAHNPVVPDKPST